MSHDPTGTERRSTVRRFARWGILLGVIAAVITFYAAGLDQHFEWAAVKARVDSLKSWVDENLVLAAVAFAVLYVTVTALSLPVSTGLTLVAGALFGRWLGAGIVSVSATIGATLAMLMCRFLFREAVERRFGARLAPLQRGIERDGAYYLLTVRLVPIFPYFLVNLAMGLTRIRVLTYIWVTWIGMLPVSIVYINVGTEISRIESPRDVLSPPLIIALALLGLIPLALRFAVRWYGRTFKDLNKVD